MTNADKLKKVLSNSKLWIVNFLRIANKEGKVVPFKLNELQDEFLGGMDKYNIILKSRQLGFSVLMTAYSLWIATTQANSTCLLMSYSIDSATGIFEKLKQMYWTIPKVLRPTLVNNNKKELKFTNGSRIIVCTCGNKDVARGLTIKFAHLSEVGFMKDTINKQLLAIEQALVPQGKIVLESTANGLNYFSELWNKASNGENMYIPYFANWYENKTMFKQDYINAVKMWKARHNGKILTKAELDAEELDLLDKGATMEQLMWRRLKIANSSLEQFKQEFPATPVEAFISTGNNVFNSKKIIERIRYIPKHLNRNQLKDLSNTLKQYYNSSFFIWEKPKKDNKYYIGVDSGEGLKQDYSVCEVFNSDGVQCAEFRSNKIPPHKFAEVVYNIGKYYNNGYLVVEKASAGHTVVSKLRYDYKYKNMHKYKSYDARGRAKKKIGFSTDSKSRPLMINGFREKFEEGQVLINSKYLLKEMNVFVSIDGKNQAQKNFHDDTVMATAMALIGMDAGIYYKS
ncbi:terminase large subunit domain-containing protein [Clostridiisalibacter paucivorans]|uniref:phage terminase large subunit family protein n=1 Tax=Clostridiisalibacter paucivorans TaxID=408753 RepID=UPI00047BFC7A|nr:terminase family protein [Clostridiisalibacter paucivorans]